MARLYWRVKKDGKWTWRPAEVEYIDDYWKKITVLFLDEEESL